MSKVKLELDRKNASEVVELSKTIEKDMTGNAVYVTPSPTVAAITTARNNVSTAITDAEAARKLAQQKTIVVNQQLTILNGLLTQLGAYVENISNGDEAKIRSAGMDVRSDSSPVGTLPKVTSVNATHGDNAGEIDLHWDRVQGAKSYVFETAVDGANPLVWQHAGVSTKSKAEVQHLQSGTRYHLQVAAVGSAGQGPWSDPVVKTAP